MTQEMEIYFVKSEIPVYEVNIGEMPSNFDEMEPTDINVEEKFFASLLYAMDYAKMNSKYYPKAKVYVDKADTDLNGCLISGKRYGETIPMMFFNKGEVFPNIDHLTVNKWE